MILGTGIDIVELDRIKTMLEKHGKKFLSRTYTDVEISAGEGKGLALSAYYAGRWAAKEATAKALGCGFGKECNFLDIEVTNDKLGKPVLKLSGNAKKRAANMGIKAMHISISHEQAYAVAMVIMES